MLADAGVDAHGIIIGHSCGSSDTDDHLRIARVGSHPCFDRFGIEALVPDDERVLSLARVAEHGTGDRIVVSHDSIRCRKGNPWPERVRARIAETSIPARFDTDGKLYRWLRLRAAWTLWAEFQSWSLRGVV